MIVQGVVILLVLFSVKAQTLEEESSDVEILDSGIVEGPVAAALVDGEDADIGIESCMLEFSKTVSLSQVNIPGMLGL